MDDVLHDLVYYKFHDFHSSQIDRSRLKFAFLVICSFFLFLHPLFSTLIALRHITRPVNND